MGANLDLDAFSASHRDSANFDRALFVGLPWRAPHEAVCSEIYSTGKMNLPGSRRERDLLNSYSRMAPEMLRMSNHPEMINLFPAHLHEFHRPKERAEKSQAERHAEASKIWNDDDDDEDAKVLNRLENARRRMALVDGTTSGGNKRRNQRSGFVALGAKKKKGKAVEVEEEEGEKEEEEGGGEDVDFAGEMDDIGDMGEAIFGEIFG